MPPAPSMQKPSQPPQQEWLLQPLLRALVLLLFMSVTMPATRSKAAAQQPVQDSDDGDAPEEVTKVAAKATHELELNARKGAAATERSKRKTKAQQTQLSLAVRDQQRQTQAPEQEPAEQPTASVQKPTGQSFAHEADLLPAAVLAQL